MKRIMVIGCCGAGKSTLSRQIHDTTSLPLYHLDKIFWKKGWQECERGEWISKNQALIKNDCWIIDGNYGSTMDMRLERADTIVYVDRPTIICLSRVIKRRYTGKRTDITTGCNEKLDFQFLHYVAMFNKVKKPEILKKLQALPNDKKVFILKSSSDNMSFLNFLRKK